MLIVGERINSTRQKVQEAIKARNASFILKESLLQLKHGADFLDINCAATSGDEVQDIDWVISVIQSEIKDANICIDSPDYRVVDRALKIYKGKGKLMINSITGEESRMKNILPLAVKYNTKLIALAMDQKGMPSTASERFEMTKNMLSKIKKTGMKESDIYFDPLIRPISTEPAQAKEFLDSISLIKSLGETKTICGLSNVSFGLPNRSLINSLFLAMAVYAGLDAAIIDPVDKNISSSLIASTVLVGADEYCANYIKAYREGRLT